MSKCPLQIYLNEKYFDSCASVHPNNVNNDGVQKNFKECYITKFQTQKPEQRVAQDNETGRATYIAKNSVFNDYLAEHCRSIEAYRSLQKQQEEVLELCKQKIAKRFPSHLTTKLNDEDIIKALRLAENSKNHLLENEKSNELVRAILNVIISGENQKLCPENSNFNNSNVCHKTEKDFRAEIAVSEYINAKRKSIFNKLTDFFTKANLPHTHRTYFTSSDNYFNNSKYTVNTLGVVRYPGKPTKTKCPQRDLKKKAFKQLLHKLAGDSWLTSSKNFKTQISSNTSMNGKQNTYLTYYCDYKRDVDILKSAVKKQQAEILSIQKNLDQCLKILRRYEGQSARNDNFLGQDPQAYHVLTNHVYRDYPNPSEPYGRNYRQYRAEARTRYTPKSRSCSEASGGSQVSAPPTSSETTACNPSNSSNEEKQRKCCGCCFKSSKKKKKKKKVKRGKKGKGSKDIHRDVTEKQSIHEGDGYLRERDVTISKETVITKHGYGSGGKSVHTAYSGLTGTGDHSANVKPSDIGTPTDTDGSKKRKRSKSSQKKKKRKKGKSKEECKTPDCADEKPRKRPCLIRCCRVLFCSSCCA